MLLSNKRYSDIGEKSESLHNYSSIDDLTDEDIEKMIETGRREFWDEWFQYIAEYSD